MVYTNLVKSTDFYAKGFRSLKFGVYGKKLKRASSHFGSGLFQKEGEKKKKKAFHLMHFA